MLGGDNSSDTKQSTSTLGSDITESKLIYARGIADGLVVRLDASADPLTLQAAVRDFMISRSGFLKGSSVFLDWFGDIPSNELRDGVCSIMKKEFMVEAEDLPAHLREKTEAAIGRQSRTEQSRAGKSADSSNPTSKKTGSEKRSIEKGSLMGSEEDAGLSLFDGIESDEFADDESDLGKGVDEEDGDSFGGSSALALTGGGLSDQRASAYSPSRAAPSSGSDFDLADELDDVADARLVVGTLRSGQRVESEHSIIIAGDVNSGAELVAGGDIFVLGKLRGVAHAGAYDETGAGRVIFALELEPTQLRIGSVITRGGNETVSVIASKLTRKKPELARVDGNMIVVEPYQQRRMSVARSAG